MAHPDRFRFSIDRGGTFTDIYAEVPGEPGFRILKLLSENPAHYPDAPREGIRRILQEVTGRPHPADGFDTSRIEWIRMGTTVATNALLERSGTPTGLVITRGFRDLLEIGYQNRPRIFDLKVEKPPPLYEAVLEVDERVRVKPEGISAGQPGGAVVVEKIPDRDEVRNGLRAFLDRGIRSVAVVFMHSYAFPDHELLIGEWAREMGFAQVSLSSQVLNRVKIVARGQTACVDAYLTPHIRRYLETFCSGFAGTPPEMFFMQSDGGLVRADGFAGSRAILSGPAGGVVGYAFTTRDSDARQPVIGFDMGGTSTDVSRYDGEFEWRHESEIAGVHLQTPQLDIRTVAAGGGSRLFYRNGMLGVGPESSGAFPGPVCYRNGGPLSLTDANLVLGRLLPEYFPKVFGPRETESLDVTASRAAFETMSKDISPAPSRGVEELAYGFIKVANETMARPIREISVLRGFDIKDHVLACFGGAGAQHACALARALEIPGIFIHRFAGVLSAYGMGLADVVVEKQVSVSAGLSSDSLPGLQDRLRQLVEEAVDELRREGDFPVEIRQFMHMRYEGTDTPLMVPVEPEADLGEVFRKIYRREFGFELTGRGISIDDLRVRIAGKVPPLKRVPLPRPSQPARPEKSVLCYFEGGWQTTPVYLLDRLGAGEEVDGPALVIHETFTVVVEPHCRARITRYGDIEIEVAALPERKVGEEDDPVQRAIFAHRFMSIAEQMGYTLQRTAISTNIKERQDFSCALFGPDGELVANAPHQPVHLGSMGEAVRHQIRIHGEDLKPGDVWMTNHPAAGGSHLPDITVITPVWEEEKPVMFVANRGHHAEIGAATPGSMPPFSRTIGEEGICVESFKLLRGGTFEEEGIRELFRPSRAPSDNISDLKAQVAANFKGVELLQELVRRYSLPVVQAHMRHIQDSAEAAVRSLLTDISITHGLKEVDRLDADDFMDDGKPVILQLTLDRNEGSAVFDFSGTGSQDPGNLNAPPAVTCSAILYCLRCLVRADIPLNEGCLRPVRIVLPPASLLNPSREAAVAAGNVLTSQRVTDVVLKAFGACAASQGCMNNLTFGDERFGYYETIGGGAGAGPGWNGASGVHTHMTNTRITDPEILERRYPVLLREFSLRPHSGGAGRFAGGNGLVREIQFLKSLHVAILSERREYAPYGLEGGEPGSTGQNLWIKHNGEAVDLGGNNAFICEPGDRIRILTPGGGGWGAPA